MLISAFVLTQIISLGCDFEGGFKKARTDINGGAYGYNLDQYCFAEPDESKVDYKKGYDSGRLHAPQLIRAGIHENPKDGETLLVLLRSAELIEHEAKQRAEIDALKAQIQKQDQTLNRLENDTSNLKNETSYIKENLTPSTVSVSPEHK